MSTKRKVPSKSNRKKQVVFDFETEPFTDQFRYSNGAERFRYAPKLRLACVFDIKSKRYSYYEPTSIDALITVLMKADQVISFNGKNFDLLVLQRHYRLRKSDLAEINRRHLDLCEEVERVAGMRFSLDKLSRKNLGESKHTKGREMVSLGTESLRAACMSDVSQTYRLYLKFSDGSLRLPESGGYERASAKDERILIHHHLPDPFPYQYIDQDCSEMTEGQMAEYLAGTWGILNDEDFTFVQR
jgi:RNase_H superfamily